MDDFPSIQERLGMLKPNFEILSFYRNRLSQCEQEQQEILDRLSDFQKTCEQQHQLERDLQQKDEEFSTLRKALSDIQACLFQEREHVLRLYAENDRLKIRELEDRRKIQKLLLICGIKYPNAELAYIINDKPGIVIPQHPISKNAVPKTRATKVKTVADKEEGGTNLNKTEDVDFLKLQIEALRVELEEKTKLAREHVECLTDECNVTREEAESQRMTDSEKIRNLTNRLKKSQQLLQQSLQDYTRKKGAMRAHEIEILEQRDLLLMELEKLHSQNGDVYHMPTPAPKRSLFETNIPASTFQQPIPTVQGQGTDTVPVAPSASDRRTRKAEFEALKTQLNGARRLSETYQAQCLKLEDELAKIREERDASKGIFTERSERLVKQLQTLNMRYKDLERRHRLEVEGFRTDIKFLRTQMQNVEKQLLKAAVIINQDEKDKEMLEAIHRTTKRSKLISDQLRAIKIEIYNLEQDLRHL